MRKLISYLFILLIATTITTLSDDKKETDHLKSSTFSGLKWRNLGPARTAGRISDFAVNPNNIDEYYVAVSSGHLWKTTNRGITWSAIADTLPYSLGVVKLDPNNPNVVWVGTGENNHQRALGYGDGVYKSTDGGESFARMGLKESRQIGGIVIDPRNSDVVYVAAEGSVWGPGGDRGLYKTEDGGKTWNKVLEISEHTGVNNIIMDPRDPDVLYATSEQRRRHAFTKIGGGPETAVYKSTDAGQTWNKIMSGLPGVHLGGMGIDISPVDPDIIYLSVEAAEGKGGFFRSTNRGASWQKMSDTHSSGQYFNEIFADPNFVDRVYLMDVVSKYTEDGGKTWKNLPFKDRHVDDHAFWINPDNSNHLLVGGDGGVYESYDMGANWDFLPNMPITQFYRVAVDNAEPFYNVYGGTQDNATLGGPSQTLSEDGITNADWIVTVFGDGFVTQIDPENPDIVYSEWQYGNIVRYDKKNGEILLIRPEPPKGQKMYKWYWDTPFIISPHSNTRLYIGAERVLRSDDRGLSWKEISGDLTTQTDRNSFKVMDKYWSTDAVSKDVSISQWGLIISLDESRLQENLVYVGTDDGLIQHTEDLSTWIKSENFPGVPQYTPVHDVVPSRHDVNVVYAVFNNHKRDDMKPYVLKSNDKGKSWTSIASNLPSNGPVSCLVEDPVNPNLLFVGTEWGVYFTIDGGQKWVQLKNGMPKVKVPDLVIQERENDLVAATFGRGFYIIDNYSPLRDLTPDLLEKESHLFPVKDAKIFRTFMGRYGQGATYYRAPNPEFGAIFTYYLKEVPTTLKSERKKKETELFKEGKPIPQPTYEELKAEEDEIPPYLIFTITDETGMVIKKINSAASAGLNRVAWDLQLPSYNPITASDNKFDATKKSSGSLYAIPGNYIVSISMIYRGEEKPIGEPTKFKVNLLDTHTISVAKTDEKIRFEQNALELARKVVGAREQAEELKKKVQTLLQTANETPSASHEFMKKLFSINEKIEAVLFKFTGQPAKASSEEIPPAILPLNWRLNDMTSPSLYTHADITKNQAVAYDVLETELPEIINSLREIMNVDIVDAEEELNKLNAPWTPGRVLD